MLDPSPKGGTGKIAVFEGTMILGKSYNLAHRYTGHPLTD